jgi:hypothetical protein
MGTIRQHYQQKAEVALARQETNAPVPLEVPPLPSEQVVVAAPASFVGSTVRLNRAFSPSHARAWYGKAAYGTALVLLLILAWTGVLAWYLIFGLLLVPYRILRRGARKRQREALRHAEMMAALSAPRQP